MTQVSSLATETIQRTDHRHVKWEKHRKKSKKNKRERHFREIKWPHGCTLRERCVRYILSQKPTITNGVDRVHSQKHVYSLILGGRGNDCFCGWRFRSSWRCSCRFSCLGSGSCRGRGRGSRLSRSTGAFCLGGGGGSSGGGLLLLELLGWPAPLALGLVLLGLYSGELLWGTNLNVTLVSTEYRARHKD